MSGKADPKAKDAKAEKGKDSKKEQDALFKYDREHIQLVRDQLAKAGPKFFKSCNLSALAAMKMLKHALSGVEEGRKSESKMSFEVMGFLVGKPEGDAYYIMDTIPTPAKGFENNVELTAQAIMFAAKQADQLEKKRAERIIGWYHSHPFNVETWSHCHLSAIDVRCQRNQQMLIPDFVAIVVDPLRSMARQEPEFGAFRTLPRDYKVGEEECPDGGTLPALAKQRRWGMSANEYYALKVNFFMSTLGRTELGIMSNNNLWVRVLGSSPILDTESRSQFTERVRKAAEKLQSAANQSAGGGRGYFGGPSFGGFSSGGKKGDSEVAQGSLACSELAIEQLKGHATQVSKDILFNNPALTKRDRPSGSAAAATAPPDNKKQ